ncbi:hypothetical protein HP436_00700 [Pseudomonas sp. CrR14]|nr:hypothetical protein [Pseudomonas sp. CrR14]
MSQHLNDVWAKNPSYIRRFYDNLQKNEKLCEEVKYIISSEIADSDVEIAHIISRAKTLESFCEKISRKKYKKPFDEITDFAGVRVVYLYSADRPKLESLIEKHFKIVEKIDKITIDDEKFGYGALHYLVKIKNDNAGARYNELRNKVCEIQVRTILQDAWALVAHHLSYKQESDIPKELRRKLNALSGLFETADDQFQNIRGIRIEYKKNLSPILEQENVNNEEEANVDSLSAYLASKFPDRDNSQDTLPGLLFDLKKHGYSTLKDIDILLHETINAALAEESMYPPNGDYDMPRKYATSGILRTALCYASPEYLLTYDESTREHVAEIKRLIKPHNNH